MGEDRLDRHGKQRGCDDGNQERPGDEEGQVKPYGRKDYEKAERDFLVQRPSIIVAPHISGLPSTCDTSVLTSFISLFVGFAGTRLANSGMGASRSFRCRLQTYEIYVYKALMFTKRVS